MLWVLHQQGCSVCACALRAYSAPRALDAQILFTKSGRLLLADLGLSTVLSSEADVSVHAVGTPFFMSPELCQGRPYGRPSDIWGLGMMLYVMCAMRPVWYGDDLERVLLCICNSPTPALAPPFDVFNSLLRKMLHKSASRRPTIDRILRYRLVGAALSKSTSGDSSTRSSASAAGASASSGSSSGSDSAGTSSAPPGRPDPHAGDGMQFLTRSRSFEFDTSRPFVGAERAFPALVEELRLITRARDGAATESRESARTRVEWAKNMANDALRTNFLKWLKKERKAGRWVEYDEAAGWRTAVSSRHVQPSLLLVHMLTQSSLRRFIEAEARRADELAARHGRTEQQESTSTGSASSASQDSSSPGSALRSSATESLHAATTDDDGPGSSDDASASSQSSVDSRESPGHAAKREAYERSRQNFLASQRAKVHERKVRLRTDALFAFLDELCSQRPRRTGDIDPNVLQTFRDTYVQRTGQRA